MQLSLILPTYNESKNIQELIPKLEGLIKKLRLGAEIVVVDDSSPDGTADIAKKLNKKYRNINVIVRQKKEGMGAAIKEGLDKAKGNILISMDVDSFDIADVEKLYRKARENYDLVAGSRHIRGGIYEKKSIKTIIKYVISFFGNKLYKYLLVYPINDFSVNFRAIKKDVWKKLSIAEKGNTYMPEIIAETYFRGYKITQVPVAFRERSFEKSKLNLAKESLRFLIKLFHFIYKYRLKNKLN